jgi:outer membrane receptor protein involved in Fe transport
MQLAQAAPPQRAAVETVTVTSSKLGGADVQSIPIAITALSQEQLTATQTAGGPDLVKQVPNLTFTKTNFSGYSIQIRGIGTQAISVTTDPAVAVAFNDVPFIRNHFFEQEFFDVSQVEVLRGPQGTLYGRNATAGVVNLIPARPSDQFEAVASAEIGNYHQRRFEGMLNLPIVDDRLDVRFAGEWTKRQGYSFNELAGQRIDGRDLWSGRVTIAVKPVEDVQVDLIWEHFSEDDDRLRSSKQLCKKDPSPRHVGWMDIPDPRGNYDDPAAYLSQGCQMVSLYSPEAFEVPNGYSLPFILGLGGQLNRSLDPYASTTQSRNLRVIESSLEPIYRAKNDVVEFNVDYSVSPVLDLMSQTAFGHDFLYSTQDYNRFNTTPGIWDADGSNLYYRQGLINDRGEFCDPQLGCSSRLVAEDLSNEHAWQLSQEFRATSKFAGPLNFSLGGNYLHYETEENYYVFINALTLLSSTFLNQPPGGRGAWIPNVTDNMEYIPGTTRPDPFDQQPVLYAGYIDPNTLPNINSQGHNYFLSQNPYKLESYALFGEVNYRIATDLTLTGGLRWTEDNKHFVKIPSEVLVQYYGYPSTGVVDQSWSEFTGRGVINWTPKLDFTDQTLVYGSYSRGYKAGGANPPGAILTQRVIGNITNPIHPLTFAPEFINAFEAGTKNTLRDGSITLNANVFYYDYKGYQISEIVDRTAINLNFDAHVKGAEAEASWEPIPGLRFNFAGGWEQTELAKGSQAIDLIDRTAGHSDWVVVKPFPSQASNCVVPDYVAASAIARGTDQYAIISLVCGVAYASHLDPLTLAPYTPLTPTAPLNYPGFDPVSPNATNTYNGHDYGPAPNNGAGFTKDLGGNELPNAPPFTVSAGAQYTIPLSSDWAGTLRGDFYWQDNSWARVFNDDPYDRLHGYTNLNLALIFTSQSGWQVMLYDKNVFNTTAITGDFLNSDDSGLTTNVFLTDPKLIGIRVTKNW